MQQVNLAQEAALDNLAQASRLMPAVASGGTAQPGRQELVDEIIHLGRMPTQSKNASVEEKRLARRLSKARKAGSLTREQEAVLGNLSEPASKTEEILQQVRDLGRSPKEYAGRSLAERQLAEKLRRARKAKLLSPEQEAELQALQQTAMDA